MTHVPPDVQEAADQLVDLIDRAHAQSDWLTARSVIRAAVVEQLRVTAAKRDEEIERLAAMHRLEYGGIPVRQDPTMPPGRIEAQDAAGNTLGAIEGIGDESTREEVLEAQTTADEPYLRANETEAGLWVELFIPRDELVRHNPLNFDRARMAVQNLGLALVLPPEQACDVIDDLARAARRRRMIERRR